MRCLVYIAYLVDYGTGNEFSAFVLFFWGVLSVESRSSSILSTCFATELYTSCPLIVLYIILFLWSRWEISGSLGLSYFDFLLLWFLVTSITEMICSGPFTSSRHYLLFFLKVFSCLAHSRCLNTCVYSKDILAFTMNLNSLWDMWKED